MANWWDGPFSTEVDGHPWAVLTNKVFLIGIRGPNKLAPLVNEPANLAVVHAILRLQPVNVRTANLAHVQAFATGHPYVNILGVDVNTEFLLKSLSKVRKSKEVGLWEVKHSLFAWKCLGITASPDWRAVVMGVKGLEDDPAPVYEFEQVTLEKFYDDLPE